MIMPNHQPVETLQDLLRRAIGLHQSGMLAEAEAAYRQVLDAAPGHPDANHLLGLVAHQSGKSDLAVGYMDKAIAANPNIPAYHNNRGLALLHLHQWDEAETSFQKALALKPDAADVQVNLGNVFKARGDLAAADAQYAKALAIKPDYPQAHFNRGILHQEQKQYEAAEAAYRKALAIQPNYAEAHGNLGNTLKEQGRFDEAIASYRQALRLNPHLAQNHSNLGIVLKEMGRLDEAEACHRQALKLNPGYTEGHINLANTLKEQGRLADALVEYRSGLRLFMQRTQLPTARPKEYMDVADAHTALLALKTALDAQNIPFFLAYGTLLGILRDGELLPHDKDMDIGLAWDADRDALVQMLAEHGFTKSHNFVDVAEREAWSITLLHDQTGINIDLFFFKPDAGSLLSGIYAKPTPLLWRFSRFGTEPLAFLGENWQVPSPPEKYLEEIYGTGWHTPDAHFDSLLSGHNREEEALDVALCFAYNRLFDRLNRGEWAKAAGYCRQIDAARPDPVIAELSRWLEPHLQPEPGS